jgi:hypothetical protein
MRIAASRGPDRGLALVLALPAAFAGYLTYVAARGFGVLAPFVQKGPSRDLDARTLRPKVSNLLDEAQLARGVGRSLHLSPYGLFL